LGDVLVTRAAKFRCDQEFRNAPFNKQEYRSDWHVPTTHFAKAEELMRSFALQLNDPVFGPPSKRHSGGNWTLDRAWVPNIIHEKRKGVHKLPDFHPIFTTDFFEFGHSNNATELWAEGAN
jgi:hypothetical protein